MNTNRKLQLASQHVLLISRADDVDMAVRNASLDKVAELIEAERGLMKERMDAAIEAATAPPPADPAPKKRH